MIPACWCGQREESAKEAEKKSEEKENKQRVVLEVKGRENDSYSRGLVK